MNFRLIGFDRISPEISLVDRKPLKHIIYLYNGH